jgi:exodeoxyribonuclease-3
LVACYTPNSGSGLHRLKYRTEEWDVAFFKYLKDLEIKNKTIILTGDLNVAHNAIDVFDEKGKEKLAGYTP